MKRLKHPPHSGAARGGEGGAQLRSVKKAPLQLGQLPGGSPLCQIAQNGQHAFQDQRIAVAVQAEHPVGKCSVDPHLGLTAFDQIFLCTVFFWIGWQIMGADDQITVLVEAVADGVDLCNELLLLFFQCHVNSRFPCPTGCPPGRGSPIGPAEESSRHRPRRLHPALCQWPCPEP